MESALICVICGSSDASVSSVDPECAIVAGKTGDAGAHPPSTIQHLTSAGDSEACSVEPKQRGARAPCYHPARMKNSTAVIVA
jgi:hypothetical protein